MGQARPTHLNLVIFAAWVALVWTRKSPGAPISYLAGFAHVVVTLSAFRLRCGNSSRSQ